MVSRSLRPRAARALATLAAAAAIAEAQQAPVCPLAVPDGAYSSFVAWSTVFNAQPHHVAAPYKSEAVPPITMFNLCQLPQWSSSSWAAVGVRGSDWIARPRAASQVQFVKGADNCSQTLSALGVSTVYEEHAALRLHFEGCGRPPSVVAFHLTNDTNPSTGTGEPTVLGMRLVDFMCRIDPQACQAAKDIAVRTTAAAGDMRLAQGKVGAGRCKGYGLVPHPIVSAPVPATMEDCAMVCQTRITDNLADPASGGSCRGYAWSDHLQSCIVYDGWPITGTDDADPAEGYFCDNITAVRGVAPAPTQPPTDAVTLDIARLFAEPRAVTARRIQVTASEAGCFADFDWYIIDRYINVPPNEFHVLLQMTRPKEGTVSGVSRPASGALLRANLVVERACIRDCVGALRAECKAQENMGTPPGYAVLPDGRLVARESAAVPDRPQSSAFNLTKALAGVMGDRAAEMFTDAQFMPWVLLAAGVSLLLGTLLTLVIGLLWRKYISRPKYHTVEEVKLIYEGEEEETLALRSTADGSMMSTSGQAWQPSKASQPGIFGSAWGSKKPW